MYSIKNRQVRDVDFQSTWVKRVNKGRRTATTLIELLQSPQILERIQVWAPWSSPWGLVGHTLGFLGWMIGFVHVSTAVIFICRVGQITCIYKITSFRRYKLASI
jgi:hypothetical protein